jgi:hypothetical protein
MKRLVAAIVIALLAFAAPAAAKGKGPTQQQVRDACQRVSQLVSTGVVLTSYSDTDIKAINQMGRILQRSKIRRGRAVGDTLVSAAQLPGSDHTLQTGAVHDAASACFDAGLAPAPPVVPPPPAPTTTTTAAPKPIYFQIGSGIQTTPTFTVPSEWVLKWHYDCSNSGGTGNFIVDVYDSTGTPDQAAGVNELGPGGDGIQNFHADPGQKYFVVNSECSWVVTIPPAAS